MGAGLTYLIFDLLEHGLIEDVPNSWHITYQVSEKGLEFINQNV
jgi:predicted transcriptional regulator